MSEKTSNPLQEEWAKANPRPHWTPEFWAACRPDHDQPRSEP